MMLVVLHATAATSARADASVVVSGSAIAASLTAAGAVDKVVTKSVKKKKALKSRAARKLAGQSAKAKRRLAYAGKSAKAKAGKRIYRGKAKRSYASKRKSSKTRYATTLKRNKKSRVVRSGGKRGTAQLASRNGPTKRYTRAAATAGGRVSGNLAGCIPSRLRVVLNQISRNFGAVKVTSSYRSPSHNRRIGGARKSWHMKCQAVDFRVSGNGKAVLGFIKSHPNVGGYKRYPAGFFHIDTGPRRTW